MGIVNGPPPQAKIDHASTRTQTRSILKRSQQRGLTPLIRAGHMPDGQSGITKLESYEPDLMVLDMMMPRQSGFLVLEHLRKTNRDRIRVIMVTGNEGERHQAYARMLGVDEYLHKPFSMEELKGHVQRLLDKPFPDGEAPSESS